MNEPKKRVNLPILDVFDVHPLVHYRRLLKEYLPRRNRGADIGHDQREQGGTRHAKAEIGMVKTPPHRAPPLLDIARVHGPDGGGDIDQVEEAKEERDLLERPVPAADHDAQHQESHPEKRNPGRDVEEAHRLGHADVFSDQRQPVDDRQIENGEPPPELAEPVEDRLRVAALGNRPQTHGHLLHVIGHRNQDDHGPEQAEAGLGPGLGVGGDAPGVVVGNHRDDARSQGRQEQKRPAVEPADLVNALADPIHNGPGIE